MQHILACRKGLPGDTDGRGQNTERGQQQARPTIPPWLGVGQPSVTSLRGAQVSVPRPLGALPSQGGRR